MTDLVTYEQFIKEVQIPAISSQEEAEEVQNIMHIRFQLIERITQIRKYKARAYRAQAEKMQVEGRLQKEELADWAIMDLEGRAMNAQAEIDHCRLMSEQHWMELAMYRAMIKD